MANERSPRFKLAVPRRQIPFGESAPNAGYQPKADDQESDYHRPQQGYIRLTV